MISGESGHRPIVVSDQVSDPRTLEIFILFKVTKGRKLVSPMKGGGNSFFSLPKCKVVFVRYYLTFKVIPYKKITL